MSRLNSHRLLAVLVLVFIGWGQADARPARVGQLPNGSMIGCASCHVNPSGGGTLTAFGRDINNNYLTQPGRSGQVVWNAALAMRDSDGDGVSNGQELGDPDGDGTVDPSIQVTNPGDPNSFVQQVSQPGIVIGGVTLQEDAKNPPLPSGNQPFEITFPAPLPDTLSALDASQIAIVAWPGGLFDNAENVAISADRLTLTGSVHLPEGATYQILIGNPDANLSEAQQYFLGTVELSDAVVSGTAMLPEGFRPSSETGGVALIDIEKYSSLLALEAAIIRMADFIIAESDPEQLLFDLQHVPDGSYALFLWQEVVDAQGNPVFDADGFPLQLSTYLGLNIITDEVDPASLIQVVNGASVTGLQVMLEEMTEPELLDTGEVSVQSVNAENNSFSIQLNGQQVSVDVSQALMVSLDQRSVEDIISIFFSGNFEDLVQLIFPISDLMAGDTVSVLGLPLSETAIQALMVIRHTSSTAANADLNGDGNVDFSDFLLFAAAFGKNEGEAGYNAGADLDSSGAVDFQDFLIFANAFGKPVG